ncbi:MAG: hypothetical protein ACXVJE_19505 [Mucilaginibacter sp.]
MSLPLSQPGPEGSTPPVESTPVPVGFLASARKRAIGNSTCLLDATIVSALFEITPGAQSCILVIEAADGHVAGTPCARIFCDGLWPNSADKKGLPIYDGATIEISGAADLAQARIASADGLNHLMNIQYYSYI